jgi:hypothetical protein
MNRYDCRCVAFIEKANSFAGAATLSLVWLSTRGGKWRHMDSAKAGAGGRYMESDIYGFSLRLLA